MRCVGGSVRCGCCWGGDWGRCAAEALDHHDAHGFLLGEVAINVSNTHRQKPCFVVERLESSVVDVDRPVRRETVQNPEVAVSYWVRDGQEACVKRDGLGVRLCGGDGCDLVLSFRK